MITRVTPFIALTIFSTALLAGCGLIPSGPPTVDIDDITDTAETALEDEFDTRYRVECGDDTVQLVVDEQLDCTATNRNTDLEYDAEITISAVSGAKFEIDVELADEANNAGETTEDDEPTEDPTDEPSEDDTDSDGPTVTGEDFAEVVADGLGTIGYDATDVECLSNNVEIFEGNIEYCFFTDENGDELTVEATINDFDESSGQYEVLTEVVD